MMTAAEIDECFPSLSGRFDITSPDDEDYNCVAWSVNDKKQWWWPTPFGQRRWPGKYWLPGIDHEETVKAFVALYERLKFEKCDSRDFETGYDKIAIYANSIGTVTHTARWWLEDKGWSSKLGEENDIRHHSLESIEGHSYGTVVQVMRRLRMSKGSTKS